MLKEVHYHRLSLTSDSSFRQVLREDALPSVGS